MQSLEVITQSKAPAAHKPTYKEYQKFLQTYNENKSDSSVTPTTLSTNSSTSSVPSVISETDNVPVAFNEYLQSYRNKKYNTVKPNLPKKNVKTELFVQVNEDNDNDGLLGRRYNTLRSRKPPGKIILARQNSLNKCNTWKNPMSPAGHQIALSPPLPKQEVVPDEMIYAKTAFLNELCTKPPKLNKSPPPIFKSTIEVNSLTSAPSIPPPPPKLPDFTNITPPISLIVKKVTPATTIPPKPSQNRPSFISEMQSKFNENSQRLSTVEHSQNGTVVTGKKSPPLGNSHFPPKFLTQHKPSDLETNSLFGHDRNGTTIVTGKKSPPLPPPPPKFLIQHSKSSDLEMNSSSKHGQNGTVLITGKKSPPVTNFSATLPPKFLTQHPKTLDVEPNTTTYVPVADNTTNVNKNDPNVKKLVYNTYRGFLGAYNNKANNMVSMPKNRVVQDQGITKQLESMELQGCLDKLNGRVNPSGESE